MDAINGAGGWALRAASLVKLYWRLCLTLFINVMFQDYEYSEYWWWQFVAVESAAAGGQYIFGKSRGFMN